MKNVTISLFATICFVLVAIQPSHVLATESAQAPNCQCGYPSLKAKWKQAGAVFTGVVMSIQPVEKFNRGAHEDPPVEVTFQVDEVFKGNLSTGLFTLHTSLTRQTCMGFPFERNKSYLVFGYQRQAATYETWSLYNFPSGTWDVGGFCGGTKALDDTTEKDINELRFIRDNRNDPDSDNRSFWKKILP